MRNRVILAILLTICILMFAGCACEHVWAEADCLNARICSKCKETEGNALGHDWCAATCVTAKSCTRCDEVEGDPLGHTPGEWNAVTDVVACSVLKERYCAVCNTLTDSEVTSISTLVQDELFLFTPRAFLERLTKIAEQHSDVLTYEVVPSSLGIQVLAYSGGKEAIIQFFRSDTTALTADEMETAEVWCVSLIFIGEGDADMLLYFFMSCDPALDKVAAFEMDMSRSIAFLNAAANGEYAGYYQQNQLLYETMYLTEADLGQNYSMSVVNVYASDFR